MAEKTDEKEKARQTIQLIISEYQISNIFYIDDCFEEAYEVEPIIGWLSDIKESNKAKINKLLNGVPISEGRDIWIPAIRAYWASLSKQDRKIKVFQLAKLLRKNFTKDNKVGNNFSSFFPDKIVITRLSPTDWKKQEQRILATISSQTKAMFFFDQDISMSKGFTSNGPRSGIGLLRDVVRIGNPENIICCLLSHTITSLNDEMCVWRELAESNDLKLSEFLPLAKLRLSNGNSPLLFADGLRKAALNIHIENLKEVAVSFIKKGSREAIKEFQNLNVYDFDRMILQSSDSDGTWEMDNLLRIFHLFQQDLVIKEILRRGNSRKINKSISLARKLTPTDLASLSPYQYTQVKAVCLKELYEENDIITHSPLETGDLFSSLDKKNYYILLAQPCDLTIRKGGTRNNPNLIAPLVQIEGESSKTKHNLDFWKTHAKIDHHFSDFSQTLIISFAKTFYYNFEVLDLAVINPSGICELDIRKQKLRKSPSRFTVGWNLRVNEILDKFSSYENELKTLQKHLSVIDDSETRDKILSFAMPKPSINQITLGSESYKNGKFNFGLQRIGRIRKTASEKILKLYTQYLSRDAHNVDFSKDL